MLTRPPLTRLAPLGALLLAPAAFGQADYSAFFQTRTLTAHAELGGGSTTASVGFSGTGAYIDSVTAVHSVQVGPNQFISTTSTVNLVSDVQPDAIDLHGTFYHSIGGFAGSGGARERITCDISFQLASTYLYNFSSVVGIPGVSPPNDPVFRDVWLAGPGGFSVAPGSANFLGALGPGIYTLHADIESRSNGWDTPFFHVHLGFPVIPAPGAASVLAGAGLFSLRRPRRTSAAAV